MSKKNEILNSLCEEFGSQWNPYAFLEITTKLAEIGNNNKSKMQYLAEETEKGITDNLDKITKLEETNTEIKNRIEQNQTLIKKKAEIEIEHAKLIEQQKQLQELQCKETELKNNQSFIDSFDNNLKQINDSIDATVANFSKKLANVQNLLSNNDLESKLKDIINAVQSNLQKVKQDDVIQCLNELPLLKTEFLRIDSEINAKIEEHNNFAKQINNVNNAFNDASEKLKAMQAAYKKHIEEDSNVFNNLTKKGEFKMENWIKDNLAELDRLLGDIEDKIRTKIDEREKLPICKILERQGNTIIEK